LTKDRTTGISQILAVASMSGKMCRPKPDCVPESLLGGVQKTLEALQAFDLDEGSTCAL